MSWQGDFTLGDTLSFKFTTRQASGAPTTLAGTPVLSAYPNSSLTELTAGITLSADFDSRTGLNNVSIVATAANGYAAATNYDIVITTGTVNSVSVVGEVVGSFSIQNRYAKSSALVSSGTAQSGGTNRIVLASGASSVDGTYDPALVRLTGGTGAGQSRMILDYVGSTRTAYVDRDWRTAPDNTTTYDIIAAPNLQSTNEGLAQGGASLSITLNSSASAVNDTYKGQTIVLRTATGQDQSRLCTGYNGTTKVATVGEAWVTTPDTTSVYIILPVGRSMVTSALSTAIVSSNVKQVNSVTINGAGTSGSPFGP